MSEARYTFANRRLIRDPWVVAEWDRLEAYLAGALAGVAHDPVEHALEVGQGFSQWLRPGEPYTVSTLNDDGVAAPPPAAPRFTGPLVPPYGPQVFEPIRNPSPPSGGGTVATPTYGDFFGFEIGANYGMNVVGDTAAAFVNDGTARTGNYYGSRVKPGTGAQRLFLRRFSPALSITQGSDRALSVSVRCYLRLVTYPDTTNEIILRAGSSSAGASDYFSVQMNTGGAIRIRSGFSGNISAYSGTVSLNAWVLAEFTGSIERNAATPTNLYTERITATIGGASASLTTTGVDISTATFDFLDIDVGMVGSATAGEIHVDDWVMWLGRTNTPPTLPTADKITMLVPTAQGESSGWSGSYTNVDEIPPDEVAGQTSSGSGDRTTFDHATSATLGITGTVQAAKLYCHAKADSVAGTHGAVLNGQQFSVELTTGYQTGSSTPIVWQWNATISPSALNDLEFGFVNSTGDALTLGGLYEEVLHQ